MGYSFQRGETLLLAAQVIAGDPTTISTSHASLRPALVSDATKVDPAQAKVGDFTVALQTAASDGSYPAFWLLTYAASASASLSIGNYIADLRLAFADGTIQTTDPLTVAILEPATTS